MRQPAISVLTSCYNAAPYLAESIESILGQYHRDFEYLLIDDGSTDGTLEILKRYAARDSRIVLIAKENTGLTDSLNVGLQRARGEWIARLDADDVAMPERLHAQLDFVNRHRDVVLVGSSSIEIDIDGRPLKVQRFPSRHSRLFRNLEHLHRFFAHSAAFYNTGRARNLGGYRPRMFLSEDWDLWLRLGASGRLGCLPEPLVKTRLHPTSICHQNRRAQAVMGVAATICHLRRRAGLSDPSRNLSDEKWAEFLAWIEAREEEEGYFSKLATRQALHAILYGNRASVDTEEGGVDRLPLDARPVCAGRDRRENRRLRSRLDADARKRRDFLAGGQRLVMFRRLARDGSLVAAGALVAGLAGLALRSVVAHRFGATVQTDALLAALVAADVFTIPLTWILTTTFVPTFTRLAGSDPAEARTVARTVLALATAVLIVLAIVAVAFAAPVSRIIVGGGHEELVRLTGSLLPFLAAAGVLVCLAGLATSLVQIHNNFWLPAVLLPARSVAAIVATVALGSTFGIRAVVGGLVVGYALQVTLLGVTAARLVPLAGPIELRHPAIREMFRRMLPMIGGTLAFQVNHLISLRFASGLDVGSITQFNYAAAVATMLAGVVGGSLTEASFPSVSRSAAADDGGRELRDGISLLLRTVMIVTAAVSAAVVASAHDIASLLFGHGGFAGAPAARTGALLQLFGIGLLALPGPTVLSRIFYAMGNTVTPQLLVLPTVALHLGLTWLLVPRYGIAAIAVATVCSHAFLSATLLRVLGVRYRVLDRPALARAAGIALLTGVAVLAGMVGTRQIMGGAASGAFAWHVGRLILTGAVGAIVFITCTVGSTRRGPFGFGCSFIGG